MKSINRLNIKDIIKRNIIKPELELIIIGHKLSDNLNMKNPPLIKTSKTLEEIISESKELTSSLGVNSLCFNQMNIPINGFVQLKPEFLIPDKYFNYEYNTDDYNVIFNPNIIFKDNITIHKKESCMSYPNLSVIIPRQLTIKVEYINEDFEKIFEEIKGFNARIFQHNFDKCEGNTIMNLSEDNHYPMKFKQNDTLTKQDIKLYKELIKGSV